MTSLRIVVYLLAVTVLQADAITPGGSYSLFNGTSEVITVQVKTISRPSEKPYKLPAGYGDDGSGDYTKLIHLSITYPGGRHIVLNERELDRRITLSHVALGGFHGHGAWWVDDHGITFISSREANIRIGRFKTRDKR